VEETGSGSGLMTDIGFMVVNFQVSLLGSLLYVENYKQMKTGISLMKVSTAWLNFI